MSPSIPTSAYSSLRSGLCIDIPTLSSATLEEPETLPASRALSANTFSLRSEMKPVVTRTSSEPDSNASRLRPRPISGPHLLRSSTGMQGLLLAETGGGLVELDLSGGGSGFKQGTAIIPGLVTPGGTSGTINPSLAPRANLHSKRGAKVGGSQRLSRHATLLSQGVSPARNAAELKSLLGNSRLKIRSGAKLLPPSNSSQLCLSTDPASAAVTLEQGKSRARVEVDILLDSEVCVEGGYLTGALHVRVRKVRAKEAVVLMAEGKMRVVGFEGIPDNNDRHTFYQHAAPLSAISASSHILYSSGPDEEGFSQACEGEHSVTFAMKLPISENIHVGAKGPFDNRSGVLVKYIVIASFKLKDSGASKHSIAHFYRSCEIYPYFKSTLILAPAVRPLLSSVARNVFLGGPGKLKLTGSLHRNVWVAGQKCCVGIAVDNESKKFVKGITLSLIRATTVFRSRPHLDVASSSFADADACQTTTTRKLVSETTLEAGLRGLRGHVTEKGWWVGVDPGVRAKFTHFILIPYDTLSIARSRLVEVNYAIRVSLIVGSLSSEVSVMLPLRIINNISIDPPPSYPSPWSYPGVHTTLPPQPVPAVGSEPASSNYSIGDKGWVMSDLDGCPSAFNGVVTRGGVPASDDTVADGLPPRQTSYIMPTLEEEDMDIGHHSPIGSGLPQRDASFCKSHNGSVDERRFSDDSGAEDVMDEDTVDDFTMDLLSNFNSDEEVGAFVGTIRPHGHDTHTLNTSEEVSETENSCDNDLNAMVSATEVTEINEHHTATPEYPSLPGNFIIRKEGHAITDSRSGLRHNVPILNCTAKPERGSSEAHTARSLNDGAQTTSRLSRTPFSRRVEKLVAAHHAASANPTNLVLATDNQKSSSTFFNNGTQPHHMPCYSNIKESQLCSLPSSTSPILCLPALTSSTSKIVMSDGAATATSLSGTVRSRIAELEGRTAARATPGRV